MLSTEELLVLQHSGQNLCPALMEKLYDMGRYFIITESEDLLLSVTQYNINVNLQVRSGNLINLSEAMEVFFKFIEEKLPDFRINTQNIFGCRGILASIHPEIDSEFYTIFQLIIPITTGFLVLVGYIMNFWSII